MRCRRCIYTLHDIVRHTLTLTGIPFDVLHSPLPHLSLPNSPHTTYLFDDDRIFLCFSPQQVKLARGRVLADFTDTATAFE